MAALEGVKSAADTTKQFIALATGVLTVTITFSDKFGGGAGKIPLAVAWVAFMLVIFTGTATLMEITRAIHRTENDRPLEDGGTVGADPYHARIKWPAVAMVVAFWVGMAAILVAGVIIVFFPAQAAAGSGKGAEAKAAGPAIHVVIERGAGPAPATPAAETLSMTLRVIDPP